MATWKDVNDAAAWQKEGTAPGLAAAAAAEVKAPAAAAMVDLGEPPPTAEGKAPDLVALVVLILDQQ